MPNRCHHQFAVWLYKEIKALAEAPDIIQYAYWMNKGELDRKMDLLNEAEA